MGFGTLIRAPQVHLADLPANSSLSRYDLLQVGHENEMLIFALHLIENDFLEFFRTMKAPMPRLTIRGGVRCGAGRFGLSQPVSQAEKALPAGALPGEGCTLPFLGALLGRHGDQFTRWGASGQSPQPSG
jgi:hypothetical protein